MSGEFTTEERILMRAVADAMTRGPVARQADMPGGWVIREEDRRRQRLRRAGWLGWGKPAGSKINGWYLTEAGRAALAAADRP